MPLGLIHLIAAETEAGSGAIYYCNVPDAIAAIYPVRLTSFPREMICPECLRVYEEHEASGG